MKRKSLNQFEQNQIDKVQMKHSRGGASPNFLNSLLVFTSGQPVPVHFGPIPSTLGWKP